MPVKVLYIAGAGRSGSTLLEMILGNLPGFHSVGEVRYFWEYLASGGWLCGCGEPLAKCEFWSVVAGKLTSIDAIDTGQAARLSAQTNRTRSALLLGAKSPLPAWRRRSSELARLTGLLYRYIWELSGYSVIVDSSKVPSHLRLLSQVPDVELYVLHLVRDSRAVAYSWSKRRKRELALTAGERQMPYRSAVTAALAWDVENMLASAIGRRQAHYALLRYEDFAERPFQELGSTLRALQLDASLSPLQGESVSLQASHSVGGNPIRFASGQLRIVPDNEWRHLLPARDRLSVTGLTAPLLLGYGYRPGG